MTRKVPWLRIAAEGIAIVASILLAFAIQAWWEERQLGEAKVQLLSTMLESVVLDQVTVTENVSDSEANLALATEFYVRQASGLSAVPIDSAAMFFNSLNQPNTQEFSGGPLSRALEGGQLGLVNDSEILAQLDDWSKKVTELAERSRALGESAQAVLQGLGSHASYQQVAFFYYPGRGGGSETRTLYPWELPTVLDLGPVRDDSTIMAAVTALTLQRLVYIRFALELKETLESLEQLLHQRLQESA